MIRMSDVSHDDGGEVVGVLLVVGVGGGPVHGLGGRHRSGVLATGTRLEGVHLNVPAGLLPVLGLVGPLDDWDDSCRRERVGTGGPPALYPGEALPTTRHRPVPLALLQGVGPARPPLSPQLGRSCQVPGVVTLSTIQYSAVTSTCRGQSWVVRRTLSGS